MYKYSIHMCFHFSCVNTVEWNGRIVSMVGFSLKELPDCFPKRLWPLHSSGFPLCYAQLLSLVQVFVISWIEACQAPLSLEFSRQEYWRGLPFPSPGDLRDPGIEPRSPALQADSLSFEPQGSPQIYFCYIVSCPDKPPQLVSWRLKRPDVLSEKKRVCHSIYHCLQN